MFTKLIVTASILLAVSSAFGRAVIVDSKPMGGGARSSVQDSAVSGVEGSAGAVSSQVSVQAQTEMFVQMQILQEEVAQLRGMLEQQAYELKLLKQQRLDDYLDLDRRISQSGTVSTVGQSKASLPVRPESQQTSISEDNYNEGEFASYQEAIGFALKQRDFERAISALQAHLKAYPKGSYVPNAQYWLGQIYLQTEDLELSKEWFSRMTQEYPSHQKAQEAKFKLAKVFHKLGDASKAESLLKEVAASGSSAAGLARDYLKQNF